MIRIALAAASIALLAGSATATIQCRDPKTGRAMKCAPKAAPVSVTKDKTGRCHVASGKDKGHFTACPKP